MIKLKNKINKSAIMRELHETAEKMYEHSYEREYAIKSFIEGAEELFMLLRSPSKDHIKSTFVKGDKVTICNDLETIIESVEYDESINEYKYWFRDENNKLWCEVEYAIDKIK